MHKNCTVCVNDWLKIYNNCMYVWSLDETKFMVNIKSVQILVILEQVNLRAITAEVIKL